MLCDSNIWLGCDSLNSLRNLIFLLMETEDAASNTNCQSTQQMDAESVDFNLCQDSTIQEINVNMEPTQQEPYTEDMVMLDPRSTQDTSIISQSIQQSESAINESIKEPDTIRRLMIYKIELKNFKSYAGEKTIGPLHKCFTTVVGPNGSGKSNLIECLLFVFGYRAKKLRTSRIYNLIHKSEQYPHCQFWSVSVYFQEIIDYVNDESKYDPISGTQFVISRIGFRDNKSKYYRNSDEWNLVDIVRMLREKGIDLEHNRFLILQGEVEMIAQMNPKGTNSKEIGFLEFLEEIIGSNKYVEQINYLSKTIEEFSEQKVEKNNTLKILDKSVKALEKEKNFAIQYIRKEERYYKLRHIFLCSEKGEASQQMDKITIRVEELKAQLTNLEDEVKKKSDTYKELIAEIKKTMEEFKVCDGYWNKLDEQFREYEREDIRKREDLKHHLDLEDRLKSDIQKFKDRRETNITTLEELNENLPKYEIEYAEISKAKDEKNYFDWNWEENREKDQRT